MNWEASEELFEKFAHLAMHPLAGEIFLPGECEDHGRAGMGSTGGEHTCCFVEPDRPLAARQAKQGLAMHAAFIGNPVAGLACGLDRLGEHPSQAFIGRSGGGSWMVIQGTLTLGQLTSFVMYLGLMIWPMLALAWMFNIVERGSAAYSRIRSMLEEAPSVKDGELEAPAGRGTVEANIQAFHYPQTARPTLENVSFTLKPGEMLGLCGPTGAGKSTILSLIQRHFDIDQGEICFHGIPLAQMQLDSWRSRLAVVNQTPFLFSDTVASNIALGKPRATQDEIEHVARLASVHEDILRLPQGYETEVGERGVMLSGGQKQRISIARALLLDAEILILDDALSAVDGRTEHQILHNLRQWGENRTVIISAHRLSALTEASEILVMQHGQVVDRGNHDALVGKPGWYRDMYRYQQLEAALDDAPENTADEEPANA